MLWLYTCVAVQHEKISPATHCERLIDRLGKSQIFLIHDKANHGIRHLHGGHRRILRVVVYDDDFKSNRTRRFEHRLEAVEQQRSGVVADDGDRHVH